MQAEGTSGWKPWKADLGVLSFPQSQQLWGLLFKMVRLLVDWIPEWLWLRVTLLIRWDHIVWMTNSGVSRWPLGLLVTQNDLACPSNTHGKPNHICVSACDISYHVYISFIYRYIRVYISIFLYIDRYVYIYLSFYICTCETEPVRYAYLNHLYLSYHVYVYPLFFIYISFCMYICIYHFIYISSSFNLFIDIEFYLYVLIDLSIPISTPINL